MGYHVVSSWGSRIFGCGGDIKGLVLSLQIVSFFFIFRKKITQLKEGEEELRSSTIRKHARGGDIQVQVF